MTPSRRKEKPMMTMIGGGPVDLVLVVVNVVFDKMNDSLVFCCFNKMMSWPFKWLMKYVLYFPSTTFCPTDGMKP